VKRTVRTDVSIPTEPVEYVSQLSKPEIQKLVIPANKTVTIVDSNGYTVGYELSSTENIEGIDYNIYTIQLGVDTYTITFQ
jgi:hypothetical protein